MSKREGDVCDIFELKANNVRDFALVIGEMKMLGTRINGVDVNYYYVDDVNAEKTLITASDAIKTFSNLFGAYPYSTYNVVRTNFLHGGMEYPGLSLISNALNDSLFTEAVIHETAHQWWYGVVGNNEVKNAWMDEGLCEFSTGLFYEQNSSYGVDAQKRLADALGAYIIYFDDSKIDARDDSMNRVLGEYKDTFEYTYCSYVKGELMFSSLSSAIGEQNLLKGLKAYYNA
jgi:aminopeptidase N